MLDIALFAWAAACLALLATCKMISVKYSTTPFKLNRTRVQQGHDTIRFHFTHVQQRENITWSSYRYTIGLVTFQRYRYVLYNTRSYPLTTRQYPRIFGMTMPLQ